MVLVLVELDLVLDLVLEELVLELVAMVLVVGKHLEYMNHHLL